jgi:tyrosyl-tRNA synthetase
VFSGVPTFLVSKEALIRGINVLTLLTSEALIFSSNGEIRRLMKDNGLSINLEKVNDSELIINEEFLINKKYIVVKQGKKNYSIIVAS